MLVLPVDYPNVGNAADGCSRLDAVISPTGVE